MKKLFIVFIILELIIHFPIIALQAQTTDTTTTFESSVKELLKLPVSEVTDIQVITASRVAEKLSDAPASMTVITRADIDRYGYRNLAEALARVPEVYSHYTGNNVDTDFRGFFTNNTRRNVLFMINGHRVNDRFHFGDFYADVIGDLHNVERIEIIRGPGGALYGNVAVLGVVNIITRNALNSNTSKNGGKTNAYGSVVFEELGRNSLQQRYALGIFTRISEKITFSIDIYKYSGNLLYDTKTQNSKQVWNSTQAQYGAGMANIITRNELYLTDVDPKGGFKTAFDIPNFDFRLNVSDFSIGGFAHSKTVSWVQPKDNSTFNHPVNDRHWATAAFFAEWHPTKKLAKLDLIARLSYNINTNREISDFSTADRNPANNVSLYNTQIAYPFGGANDNRFLKDENGKFYRYTSRVNRRLFSDSAVNVRGGGMYAQYAGIDKSVGFELQLTPYKSEKLTISTGGNVEIADYQNIQWFSYRDLSYVSARPGGGISDNGWYGGLWLQAIYKPTAKLSFTAGLRYDYQFISDVHRNLEGNLVYRVLGAKNDTVAWQIKNVVAQNFTPRIAGNYRFSDKFNMRLIYAQAFRAVPPQEVIRLPDGADYQSEKTQNLEMILSYKAKNWNIDFNTFYLENNVLYQFAPTTVSFNAGSSWNNSGATISVQHFGKNIDFWANSTYYFALNRPTDAFGFMRDWKNPRVGTGVVGTIGSGGIAPIYDPLPNSYKPLDSPTFLLKGGAAYRFNFGTSFGLEGYFNGSITAIFAANNNVGEANPASLIQQGNQIIVNPNINPNNFTEYKVPASFYTNLSIRHDFAPVGFKGLSINLKVINLFSSDVWNLLNADAQAWNSNIYTKPNQLPDFGRRFMFSLNYNFTR